MRRWQIWFFGRWGQSLFWIALLLAGWVLVATTDRPRWWWPFERQAPRVALAQPGGATPSGWTAVAKAAMPAVVNISSSKSCGGRSRGPRRRFSRIHFSGSSSIPSGRRGASGASAPASW
jgi:hypothetical protein